MAKAQTNEMNGNGRVFYRGTELVGYEGCNKYFAPKEMLEIHTNYETYLRKLQFDRARRSERRRKAPITWLNCVISSLAREDKGLAKKLIIEFADRGFLNNKE
jgi:hypothetical protein